MPSSLVSSWSAVTKSLVPATLKSMSPNASSAPRMSVSATYCGLAVDLVGDQAHRDARDRRPQRHTGVEQRQVEAQTEPIEVEPLEPSASETCRIAYGNSSRVGSTGTSARSASAPWPISRRFGRADPAGLTGGVRREVVVVHVALGRLRAERVELLLHAEHVQRGDAQDLGLAALEQRRAVHPRQHARPRRTACGCRSGRGRRCGPCRAGSAAGPASWSARGTRR